jgi:hypothetical protein
MKESNSGVPTWDTDYMGDCEYVENVSFSSPFPYRAHLLYIGLFFQILILIYLGWGGVSYFLYSIFFLICFYELSLAVSAGVYGSMEGIYPQNISIQSGTIHISYTDSTKALSCGLEELYLLSECVWYCNWADWLLLNRFGIFLLPCYMCKVINIYHIPTGDTIICGITGKKYKELQLILKRNNVYECRKRSRFEFLAVSIAGCTGFIMWYVYCPIIMGVDSFWTVVLLIIVSQLCVGIASILCGNDWLLITVLRLKKYNKHSTK